MSNMSDGLNMQPRVKEPDSPFVVPGMGVPVSPPADLGPRARATDIQPQSIQFPPLIPDTSGPAPQPPGQALQEVANWQYDFTSLDGVTGISRATFPGMVNFQSSQSTPTIPVTIAQGGTNRTNWVTNGYVTYSSTPTPQMTPLGGNGVAIINLNTPSIAVNLPISMGGTGTGLVTQGLLTSDGTGTGSYTATAMKGGQNALTDESASNLGTLGTQYWYRIGQLVWVLLSGTYPTTAGDSNPAILGPLPYHPIASVPMLLRCNIANMGVLGVANNSVVTLFNVSSQVAMQNGGMSGVGFQAFYVYQTNDAP